MTLPSDRPDAFDELPEGKTAPRRFIPGNRKERFRLADTPEGKPTSFTDERYAWATFGGGQWQLIVVPHEKTKSGEFGPEIFLKWPRPGRTPDAYIMLSHLSESELDSLETLFTEAFKWARPVVVQRDKDAKNAFAAGDDTISRAYRPVSQLVFRKRPELQHDEGVHDRPEDVPPGDGSNGDSRD